MKHRQAYFMQVNGGNIMSSIALKLSKSILDNQ